MLNTHRASGFGIVACFVVGTAADPVSAQSVRPTVVVAASTVLREDPVRNAYLHFRSTGRARIIMPEGPGGFVLFPFGHERPLIRCPRLNACLIALEPGERLTDDPLSGDTERWIITTSTMGGAQPSALVVIKPQACDLATNMVIPTDRRVYELALVSDACKQAGDTLQFTRQVKFWYPDAMRAGDAADEEPGRVLVSEPARDLNREYDVDRGWFLKRKRYAWIPSEVFDDGLRTFIVLPQHAAAGELPILYMLEDGERHVLNYALRGDTIVADRVLRRAVLVVGSGEGERTVEIENRLPFRHEEEER